MMGEQLKFDLRYYFRFGDYFGLCECSFYFGGSAEDTAVLNAFKFEVTITETAGSANSFRAVVNG